MGALTINDIKNKNATQRRGVQIERMLYIVDILRSVPSVSLVELRKKVKPKVCERTIRRDLMILMRMGCVIPCGDVHTRWQWVKD